MQYKTLGDTGLLVSTICLGCMTFHGGSGFWSTIGNVDQAGADGLVKGSIEAGVNFFDTADVYSEGESEKTLGQSLNSAGGVKELYYSNAGMIDMDKKRVTPDGGLQSREAAAMGMKANLLPSFPLVDHAEAVSTSADTGGDPETSANMRNWMECVRSRKMPNASIEAGYNHSVALCMNIAAIQTGEKVTFDDKRQQVMAGGKVYE